jgi:hypothetical protein
MAKCWRGASDLYPSPNIIRMIKSRRVRSAEQEARLGEEYIHVLVSKLEG